jgi:hypothetical protein
MKRLAKNVWERLELFVVSAIESGGFALVVVVDNKATQWIVQTLGAEKLPTGIWLVSTVLFGIPALTLFVMALRDLSILTIESYRSVQNVLSLNKDGHKGRKGNRNV